MDISVKALWAQKAGNIVEEYEDAFYPSKIRKATEYLFAIADGATETSFSGIWANILTKAFVEKTLSGLQPESLQPLVQVWEQQIAEVTKEKPLTWYAEEKLRKGAYSSLLGFHLIADKKWTATAVGDSCLFQLRSGEIIRALPYGEPTEFNNRPALLSTNLAQNSGLELMIQEGTWEHGDRFFLMTDALAECFLSNRQTIEFFTQVKSRERFTNKIDELRRNGICRNDDVTFIRIHIAEPIGDIQLGLA